MKYFAYGSNMSVSRLKERVPGAFAVGVYRLEQHELRFHKKSKDGSAKCDAYFTGLESDFVLGVVFQIDPSEKKNLDRAEGLGYGYEIKEVTVKSGDQSVKSFLYCATKIDDSLKPYIWYLEHVLRGAQAAGLPQDYISKINSVAAIEDQNTERALN